MNSEETGSLFGSLIGGAVGWYIGGPMGAAVGSSILGGVAGSIFGADAQRREQRKLKDAQRRQAALVLEKTKADKAELFSSVQSAITQTSGGMGAVY